MERCCFPCKQVPKKKIKDSDRKIRRFSKIENEKDVPFFTYYNPIPDPVVKQEKRKMKSTEHPVKKPKIRMKCISCKDKKVKAIELEEKKIEKYIAPITKRQQLDNEERHKKEKAKYFVCKKDVIRLPSPVDLTSAEKKDLQYDSPYKQGKGKVMPEKISMTDSTMKWPPEPPKEELLARVPKSTIFINKSRQKDKEKEKTYPPVDSIDFIYNPKYREFHPWYEMYRARDSMQFIPQAPAPSSILSMEEEQRPEEMGREEIEIITQLLMGDEEEEEEVFEDKRDIFDDITMDSLELYRQLMLASAEEEEEEEHHDLPKSISKVSVATSINSEYRFRYPDDDQYDTGSLVPSVINRILQKYQRDSELEITRKEKQPFKKGTLRSHSTSKIPAQPKSFFFGVVLSSTHYGDPTYPETSRYRQGLPMCVVAYVMSFVAPPQKWSVKDMDFILDVGNKLYLNSLETMHLHDEPRILQPEELLDTVEFVDKKIKYKIDEPDIAGFTRSKDPKVYNLLKGLTLFFKRNRAGIFQTYNTNILIFRHKFFFVFDPEPRTKELYSDEETGKSILASFYDIPSVLIMLLDRGKLDNWPYIISKISIKKIMSGRTDKQDTVSLTSEIREESLYQIIDPYKAVVSGSFGMDDPCFGDLRNKLGFAVATIALVYTHITPACAWHKRTIDKILMVANQFYIECLKDTEYDDLRVENLPAFFTVGPLMIEIAVYANQYAGLMFRKNMCLFEELLTKFFCHNSSAYVEIDKYVFGVWKFRDVFYMFDPYPRNREGLKAKEGLACVSMNVNLHTLVNTLIHNYPDKDYIFKIHALKIVRINRDPEFEQFGRNIITEGDILQKKGTKYFLPKKITVDKTEKAMRTTKFEEPLQPSIVQVGSLVGSLKEEFVQKIPICPSKAIIPEETESIPKICDLDSPSLSDTQIVKDQPSPLKTDSFEFRLLDEILKEEMELNKLMELGEGADEYLTLYENLGMDVMSVKTMAEMEDEITQKGRDFGIVGKRTVLTNTDLLGLYPVDREVLLPNKPPKRKKPPSPRSSPRIGEQVITITQSAELLRPSNFITLPDGSQILYGTRNVANLGDDYDNAAPFVCAVAAVMSKKYTLNTWNQEVVDAILDYGFAVHQLLEVNFSYAPKIDIPKLTIGSQCFHLTIEYIFDSLLAQSILEQCLEKLVFRDKEHALVITQNYGCAVFKKRLLYYMYDPYGNNLVGLGEGPDNTGVACMFRFTTLYALVSRILYNKKQRESVEPTEAARFVISITTVKVVIPPSLELIPRREKQVSPSKSEPKFVSNPEEVEKEKEEKEKEKSKEIQPKNKVGFQRKDRYLVIEGSEVLTGRDEGSGKIKECHFICICALIGIFGRKVSTWDTKRIDHVSKMGKILFGYVDNMNFADRRNISNLLFDKYFFDLIVKRIPVPDAHASRHFATALDHMLFLHKFLLMQFSNCCYVLYKGKDVYYLFDPYGVQLQGKEPKSCWIKFQNRRPLLFYLKRLHKESINTFFFYTINVSHIKKASKKNRLEYKLRVANVKKQKKHKSVKVFVENENWLTEYPIPWSRMKKQGAAGVTRGKASHKWFNWDVEYPGDLYSLLSTKHQSSNEFPSKTRNKQTIANCIVSIIMTEVYDFTEWNSNIMDAILVDGDRYFYETFKQNKTKNYEIRVEDFPLNVNVFPYNVNIDVVPLIEGTMFLTRPQQFNLSKALRYFFEEQENRTGLICCNNGKSKTKYVAFGRIREGEYFMFDCQTIGPPMFVDRMSSRAYMLRCVTLNRLLHIMTMTLRGGDFFIYQLTLSEEQTEQVIKVEDLEAEAEAEGKPESRGSDKKSRPETLQGEEQFDQIE